jgi:hypothetical protein
LQRRRILNNSEVVIDMNKLKGDSIDITALFQEMQLTMIIRVQEAANNAEEIRSTRGTAGLTGFADQVLDAIRVCSTEMAEAIPESRQWPEALDICTAFVNEQCQWLQSRCQAVWGEDAQQVQMRIYQMRNKMITEMEEDVRAAQRQKRRRQWETRVRSSIKLPTAETAKLLISSTLALIVGFLLGRYL